MSKRNWENILRELVKPFDTGVGASTAGANTTKFKDALTGFNAPTDVTNGLSAVAATATYLNVTTLLAPQVSNTAANLGRAWAKRNVPVSAFPGKNNNDAPPVNTQPITLEDRYALARYNISDPNHNLDYLKRRTEVRNLRAEYAFIRNFLKARNSSSAQINNVIHTLELARLSDLANRKDEAPQIPSREAIYSVAGIFSIIAHVHADITELQKQLNKSATRYTAHVEMTLAQNILETLAQNFDDLGYSDFVYISRQLNQLLQSFNQETDKRLCKLLDSLTVNYQYLVELNKEFYQSNVPLNYSIQNLTLEANELFSKHNKKASLKKIATLRKSAAEREYTLLQLNLSAQDKKSFLLSFEKESDEIIRDLAPGAVERKMKKAAIPFGLTAAVANGFIAASGLALVLAGLLIFPAASIPMLVLYIAASGMVSSLMFTTPRMSKTFGIVGRILDKGLGVFEKANLPKLVATLAIVAGVAMVSTMFAFMSITVLPVAIIFAVTTFMASVSFFAPSLWKRFNDVKMKLSLAKMDAKQRQGLPGQLKNFFSSLLSLNDNGGWQKSGKILASLFGSISLTVGFISGYFAVSAGLPTFLATVGLSVAFPPVVLVPLALFAACCIATAVSTLTIPSLFQAFSAKGKNNDANETGLLKGLGKGALSIAEKMLPMALGIAICVALAPFLPVAGVIAAGLATLFITQYLKLPIKKALAKSTEKCKSSENLMEEDHSFHFEDNLANIIPDIRAQAPGIKDSPASMPSLASHSEQKDTSEDTLIMDTHMTIPSFS